MIENFRRLDRAGRARLLRAYADAFGALAGACVALAGASSVLSAIIETGV